jgi:hypothetical protein
MRLHRLFLFVLLAFAPPWKAASQEIRPGVSAAQQVDALPLPSGGYEAYLVGELHGIEENSVFQLRYLERLHRAAGLRDVVIEEDAVYENDAQAFVDGRSDVLPRSLCLRAPILHGIRRLNGDLSKDSSIRVHLTDVDSPAAAIRSHLATVKQRLNASRVQLPPVNQIKSRGMETLAQLKRLSRDGSVQWELRTIEFSILALQEGLEIDIAPPKGSPYLDSREEAVASNIADLLRSEKVRTLLVIYGSDHVSRTPRKDGGPNRDQPFAPMALRLDRFGIKTFNVITFPLAGRSSWRGQESDLPWMAGDGHLASGETLDRVLAAAPEARFLYIDPKRESPRLPSDDISRMAVDAFVLFPYATPLKDDCRKR